MNGSIPAGFRRHATAILIGAAGGALFNLANLPLAWMLGAMCATTLAAIAGVRLELGRPLRSLFICVLGVMIGSAFAPELLGQADKWLAGALVLGAVPGDRHGADLSVPQPVCATGQSDSLFRLNTGRLR